jgi:hypothetical protein
LRHQPSLRGTRSTLGRLIFFGEDFDDPRGAGCSVARDVLAGIIAGATYAAGRLGRRRQLVDLRHSGRPSQQSHGVRSERHRQCGQSAVIAVAGGDSGYAVIARFRQHGFDSAFRCALHPNTNVAPGRGPRAAFRAQQPGARDRYRTGQEDRQQIQYLQGLLRRRGFASVI